MANKIHYLHEGDILCSTRGKSINTSSSIIEVSCGHCWKLYDDLEGRGVNIPEVKDCARMMRFQMERAIRDYRSGGTPHLITKYALWFLVDPDDITEDVYYPFIVPSIDDSDSSTIEAKNAKIRSFFGLRESLQSIWGHNYVNELDRLKRAMRPVLNNTEESDSDVISSNLRHEVLDRGGNECEVCGIEFEMDDPESSEYPTIDHVVPTEMGGPSKKWNLRVICRRCNSFKHTFIDPDGLVKVANRLRQVIES